MVDEIASKTAVVHRGKSSTTPNEVNSVENVNKNFQSFPRRTPVQKEVLFHINYKIMHVSYRFLSN